jgi:hypothetical protein
MTVVALPRTSTPKTRARRAKQPVSAHRARQERIAAGIRTGLTAVNVGVIAVSLTDIANCAIHYGHSRAGRATRSPPGSTARTSAWSLPGCSRRLRTSASASTAGRG